MAKRKQGRPTDYRKAYDKLAYKFCLLGATNEDLARSFEVNISSIKEWMKVHPSFSASIKEGRETADANVANSLYRRAIGYEHKSSKIVLDRKGVWQVKEFTEHYPPDATSAIFWLKNRRPDEWREKLDIETKIIRVKVEGEEEE